MLTRWSALPRSQRLRATGWLVLTFGLLGAAAFYWVQIRNADPTLDDTTALGYTRSMQHQIGVAMGHFGIMLMEWQNMLTSPLGEALIIAACAALFAGYFFRVAWVIDEEERDRSG